MRKERNWFNSDRKSPSKYGNVRTEYNGYRYDSKFEAEVAASLDWQKEAGQITDWERQYKLEMWAYDCNGDRAMKKTHKVDFRVHEVDGSFTLLEAKGAETQDYRDRRNWLEKLWLPEHPDHVYEVVRCPPGKAARRRPNFKAIHRGKP
ncbi:DUF1064 domain-containing protein [uncultured Paraglaciecola sp.]|uniref:DUF1064 domain-containing protein n=1 Tax=uncultured Paraglaciecola sp. TaxID=1765024 RepID=UPI00260D44F4|nr:DUF1064 domain-containing protein [uncultured Paraglaciecola sp.]